MTFSEIVTKITMKTHMKNNNKFFESQSESIKYVWQNYIQPSILLHLEELEIGVVGWKKSRVSCFVSPPKLVSTRFELRVVQGKT